MGIHSIIATGDVHGKWKYLNNLINKKRPAILLQCGDFGYWPKFHNTTMIGVNLYSNKKRKKWNQYGLKPGNCKIYWCDGNHEDHWAIKKELIETENYEIQQNVFYQPRGSTIELPDGRTVLFMGGAESVDKNARTLGYDWFPDEVITQMDIENLSDFDIDIVISHTCPREFHAKLMGGRSKFDIWAKREDPSMMALSYILHKYRPKRWYFGHFHTFGRGYYENTKTVWTALGMAPEGNWWIPLLEE